MWQHKNPYSVSNGSGSSLYEHAFSECLNTAFIFLQDDYINTASTVYSKKVRNRRITLTAILEYCMRLRFPKVHFSFSHRPWAAKGAGVMSSPALARSLFHSDENSPLFLLLTSFFFSSSWIKRRHKNCLSCLPYGCIGVRVPFCMGGGRRYPSVFTATPKFLPIMKLTLRAVNVLCSPCE